MSADRTAWERSMHPHPSVPSALAHLAAELFGSLFVVGASFALIASVVLIGGGTEGGNGDRLVGLALGAVALPVFGFGRYLISQHAVSPRRWNGPGRGGPPPPDHPPAPSTPRERHVVAGRRPAGLHNVGRPERRRAARRRKSRFEDRWSHNH